MKKRLYFIGGIVLYAAAGLLLAYSIWAFIHCADIISQAKSSGQLAATGNEYDIVSFYMSNCLQYVVYALLVAAAGMILHKKDGTEKADNENNTPAVIAKNDDNEELDEWFEENREPSPNLTEND